MATDNAQLIEQLLPDNSDGLIDPADVRAVAHALDNQVPNQRRGGPFFVTCLTQAQAEASGLGGASGLDQLAPDRLCLGAVARVAQHPDQAGQWLVLVFDGQATTSAGQDGAVAISSGLLVALDGNFQGSVPAKWVKLGSAAATAANVPAYAGNVVYPLGYLVRYGLPGGRESFYYSLASGQLPVPVPGQSSASWRLVPGPVAETLLYQYLTLNEAQSIEGAGVIPGRRYGVVHTWNNSADEEVVYLDGLENYFRQRGTVLHADGSQQEVEVSIGLGTYTVATSGPGGPGYSDAQARAAQLNRVAPAGTVSVTLTAESPTDYGTAASTTFTVDATGCVVGQCAFFNVGPGAGEPSYVNAPAGQPFDLTLATFVPGQLNRYALRVFADRVEVLNLVR